MTQRYARAIPSVIAVTLTLILSVSAVSALLAHDLYDSAISDGKSQAERFVTSARAAVNRSLLGVDVFLAGLNNLMKLDRRTPSWLSQPAGTSLLQGAAHQNLLLRNVWLLNAQGTVVASSNDPGEEIQPETPFGFVTEVVELPVSTLVISQPVVSSLSSEEVVYFGRHLKLADGSKVVAVAEVPVALITNILVQGANISQLEASLERGNGHFLASMPARDASSGMGTRSALGADVRAGAQIMPSRILQRPALVAALPTLYNDLLITASIPMQTVLATWHVQVRLIGLGALTFCLFLAAAGFSVVRHLQAMARAQRSISEALAMTDQALESMENGFLVLDAQRRVLTWNRRYLEIFPKMAQHIKVGLSFDSLVLIHGHDTLGDATEEELQRYVESRLSLLSQGAQSHEREFIDGQIVEITDRPIPNGGTVIVYQDVTRLRRASAEIEKLAFFDPLTGLPNRWLLSDRLQQAGVATSRNRRHGALLFLDLDDFKTLNDTLGHDVGDLLLQQVARRVKSCVREVDTVARLGGDEFVVMLLDLSADAAEAARQTRLVGDNILRAMTNPYELQGHTYQSSCSLGATMFGPVQQSAADLLKQADIAMYQVKKAGRNGLCFFDASMQARIEARARLENDLRRGLTEQQFELYYQLQVTSTGKPIGAEALIRWHHPVRGLVLPGEFIGPAEETHLILPIGQWVLEQACKQLKAWQASPATSHLQLSVNVSARQFHQADFVDQVRVSLLDSGVPSRLLKLELTESLVLDNVDDTIEKMHAIKALGVRFSLDDFGTGYSSLGYLTRLPLGQLKIDRSFVRNIGLQDTDSTIIQTIIGMAHNLGLQVLAEGVETEAQRAFLDAHGCRLCQGFLFGRPMPADEFTELCSRQEPLNGPAEQS